MVCIFYYFNRKTFLFQLQAKFKKLFQPEIESNVTVCAAAWIKKKKIASLQLSCFQPHTFTDEL